MSDLKTIEEGDTCVGGDTYKVVEGGIFDNPMAKHAMEQMDPETREYYKRVGEKFYGYDVDNLDPDKVYKDNSLIGSHGKMVVMDDAYKLKQVIKNIKMGLDINDIREDEYRVLCVYTNMTDKDEIEKWVYTKINTKINT
jgi:hypothetical protein